MSKSIYEKATDKNIITKQVVINTPTSAHLLPITADEKSSMRYNNSSTN